MKELVRPPGRLEGTVRVPGDKSISQRAVMLNSIATGTAHVSNLCVGDDRNSVLRCMRGLGVKISRHASCVISGSDECFEVEGRGLQGLTEPSAVLNAGNSGTTMRLVTGLLAAQPFFSVITGDRSLRSRDMARVVQPLTQMGAQISGRAQDSLAPLAIRGGNLSGIEYDMPVPSAQIKSCLLIAGLHASGRTVVSQSAESRDHTERLLRAMGADVQVDGLRVGVGPSELTAVDVSVPGDVSSAAFWMVAAACHPNARIKLQSVGMNPTRDGVIRVLQAMGARMAIENVREDRDEPVADITIESSALKATEIGGELIPHVVDELPVLGLAACHAKGTTVITDAAELRVKESDRILATVEGLSALGASIEETPDGMVVRGVERLKGGATRSHEDHRIAMTMGVAGLVASGNTVVEGSEAAGVSYPQFWDTLASLSGSRRETS